MITTAVVIVEPELAREARCAVMWCIHFLLLL